MGPMIAVVAVLYYQDTMPSCVAARRLLLSIEGAFLCELTTWVTLLGTLVLTCLSCYTLTAWLLGKEHQICMRLRNITCTVVSRDTCVLKSRRIFVLKFFSFHVERYYYVLCCARFPNCVYRVYAFLWDQCCAFIRKERNINHVWYWERAFLYWLAWISACFRYEACFSLYFFWSCVDIFIYIFRSLNI